MPIAQPFLSVIIPTYLRSASLHRTLNSLEAQIYSDFEIIVADNAVDSSTGSVVTQFSERFREPPRYLAAPEPGLHSARHRAAKEALGNVLVFTDDDATFDVHWLDAFAKAFYENPDMAAAGGPVSPLWDAPPPQWLLRLLGSSGTSPLLSLLDNGSEFQLSTSGGFFGVNMAIRRPILFELGGFNPDSFGDRWLGDGESGLNRKLWKSNMLVGYVPSALVYHHIPPSRMTRRYLLRRMANEGACTEYAKFHACGVSRRGILSRIPTILLDILREFRTTGARLLRRRNRSALLNLYLNTAYAQGRLAYTIRLWVDPNLRHLVEKERWLAGDV